MDLYSRMIVGWSMRDDLEAPLVVDAISMAISRRKPGPGLVHHSDSESVGVADSELPDPHSDRRRRISSGLTRIPIRGSQYMSIAMGRTLCDSKIMASMGSKGDPWDNASAESCISTIKNELVKRRTFATQDPRASRRQRV
jgi:transposase InsO family protein